jgi:site-specific recombinase XerD
MRKEDLLQKISFSTAQHNNKSIICCRFANDKLLNNAFKKYFPAAKWSNTLKCWYMLDLPAVRLVLNMQLKNDFSKSFSAIHPANQEELKRMKEQLILKAYSVNTQKVYLTEFTQLLVALKSNLVIEMSADKLRSYLLYCIKDLGISENHLQSRLNALKFYFEQVLHQQKFFFDIPRPKKQSKLPKVIAEKDILKILKCTENIKHNLMLQLCYGMGLRVSELVNLKITDIDSNRMQVLIENSKGKKDRMVVLPETVLDDLRNYYKTYKPKEFLFEGIYGGQYSIRSVQEVFKTALRKAKINKSVGIHSLRHSYATHLLEYGTDITYIQKLLGHADIKTTLIYANVSDKNMHKIQSPLDRIKK